MKKLIAMLMVGGILAVSTVGCGPTPSTAPTVKVETGKDKDTTVKTDKDTTVTTGKDKDTTVKTDKDKTDK